MIREYRRSDASRVKPPTYKIPIPELHDYSITKDGRVWSNNSKRFLRRGIKNERCTFQYYDRRTKKYNHFPFYLAYAWAFLPNPNNYENINFINGDTLDTRLQNMEWVK